MAWGDLTICIKAAKANGRYAIGTGFPVARGLVLTARHVVRPDGATGEVLIRWWHSVAEGFGPKSGAKADGFLAATIEWEDKDLDVALLEAPHPPGAGIVHLTLSRHRDGECRSEGFPTGARVDGITEQFRVRGHMHTLDGSGDFFQVDLSANPQEIGNWGGLSGALVIDPQSGTAAGVFSIGRSALDENKYAKAVPGSRIWKAPGFAERLGQIWRTHEPDGQWQTVHEEGLLKLLASRLAKLPSNRCKDLLAQCGVQNADLVSSKPDQAANELCRNRTASVDRIRAYQKAIEDDDAAIAERIGQVAWLVALLDLEEDALRLVAYMAQERDNAGALPLGGPARTLTLLELIAAAIDGQAPEYLPRHAETDLPRGAQCLPFVAPESGPGGNDVGDFVGDLCARMGIVGTDPSMLRQSVEGYLAQDDLGLFREHVVRQGEHLDERSSTRLRRALDRRRKDGDRSFYVPIVFPTDPDEADRLRDGIHRLRELYRDILALSLDPNLDLADEEEVRLARLISTVPLLKDRG